MTSHELADFLKKNPEAVEVVRFNHYGNSVPYTGHNFKLTTKNGLGEETGKLMLVIEPPSIGPEPD